MESNSAQICQELLDDIEKVFPPVTASSAKLTSSQIDELNQMRDEIRRLCEARKDEDARRVAQLAISLIQSGPPESE